MADIQSRMIALQPQPAVATTAATGTAATGAAATGTTAPAFSAHLKAAVAATKSYAVNSKGIPTDLAAYGNGKVPASALEQVGATGHKLWAPAAESLTKLIADAKKDGVTIGITDSYRSYAEQVDIAQRKGLYSRGGLAAQPGTSEHGWGLAADLDLNGKALSWMRANGDKYGFDENVPRENWHWAYQPKAG